MRRFNLNDPNELSQLMKRIPADLEISEVVKPTENDLVLTKCFANTNIFLGMPFEQLLRNRGVTTILLTGMSTEI
jgi:isochorismate hydrolase